MKSSPRLIRAIHHIVERVLPIVFEVDLAVAIRVRCGAVHIGGATWISVDVVNVIKERPRRAKVAVLGVLRDAEDSRVINGAVDEMIYGHVVCKHQCRVAEEGVVVAVGAIVEWSGAIVDLRKVAPRRRPIRDEELRLRACNG